MRVARYNTDGSLDTTFGVGGTDGNGWASVDIAGTDTGEDVGIDPQGRILVAGNSSGGTDFGVARLLPDGSPDNSFDGDGEATVGFVGGATAEQLKVLLAQTDGRVVVAGMSGNDFAVAQLSGGGPGTTPCRTRTST